MEAILPALLALLETIAPTLTGTAIANVITTLENILPIAVKLGVTVYTVIKNIIAALKNDNPNTTVEQVAQLQVLDQQCDAEFEAAAAAAQAEDAAADQTAPTNIPAPGTAEGTSGQ